MNWKNREQRLEHYKIQNRLYRLRKPILVKLSRRLDHRIWNTMRRLGLKKLGSLKELLGCSITDWKDYLYEGFIAKYGVSDLENIFDHTKYEIHHKIPLSVYSMTTLESQQKAFNYTNTEVISKLEHNLMHKRVGRRGPGKVKKS
jgi:hypothetical protein